MKAVWALRAKESKSKVAAYIRKGLQVLLAVLMLLMGGVTLSWA